MDILIGTNNKDKIVQFRRIFARYLPSAKLFSLKEVEIFDDVDEDKDNLLENAKKKAKFFGDKSKMITMADDTGLFIDFLNGEPGIHSKRWLEGTETDRNIKILERMINVPEDKRTCQYKGVLAIYNPFQKNFWTYEGIVKGKIATNLFEGNGFGYDPIFITETYGKYYSQLTNDEIDAIIHRGLGIKEFAKKIFLEQKI